MTQTTLPNSNQVVQNDRAMFTNPWFVYLQSLYRAIRAKFSLNLSGILSIDTTSAGNVDAAETDLMNYSLMANTLANNGDVLAVEASGYFSANANNKTLKLKFGSQTILDTGTVAANNLAWKINATIVRKTPTIQEISATIILGVSISITRTEGTQDLTTTLTVKCTGQGIVTNDLTETALIIGLTPND